MCKYTSIETAVVDTKVGGGIVAGHRVKRNRKTVKLFWNGSRTVLLSTHNNKVFVDELRVDAIYKVYETAVSRADRAASC